jgi:transposase
VERAPHLLKRNRTVATRHDERAAILDGTVQVASIRIGVRVRDSTRSANSA